MPAPHLIAKTSGISDALHYEWDAATVFLDPLALTFPDPNHMKKASKVKLDEELWPEYDLSKLKGGVRGKYRRQATASTARRHRRLNRTAGKRGR